MFGEERRDGNDTKDRSAIGDEPLGCAVLLDRPREGARDLGVTDRAM
jgi:hypothetical protein